MSHNTYRDPIELLELVEDGAYSEGYEACGLCAPLASNPYPRHSPDWEEWRNGWASADYFIWQAIIIDKRKAATE